MRIVGIGGRHYIYLCLNCVEGDDTYEDGEKSVPFHYWEYDYTEINAAEGEIDLDDLGAHPEDYLNYTPPKKKTEIEEIRSRLLALETSAIGG